MCVHACVRVCCGSSWLRLHFVRCLCSSQAVVTIVDAVSHTHQCPCAYTLQGSCAVFCELSSFVALPHLGACMCVFLQATTALEAIEGRHVPNFGFLYINYNDHGYAKVPGHH